MNGQWTGQYTGSSSGLAIINIDDIGDRYKGVAYLHDANFPKLPSVVAFFETKDKNKNFKFRTQLILPINPKNGMPDSWDNIKQLYQGVTLSNYSDVQGNWNKRRLTLKWKTEIGIEGTCEFPKSKADQPSEYNPIPEISNWNSYKQYVNDNYMAELEGRRFLFRGQKDRKWRLRTKFHRTGRADLNRFLAEDIQTLHRYLSARTRHVFNLANADENGAFFNLVQHHGYPTPLLDWTYSPYVGAFFAYRGVSNSQALKAGGNEKVRILVFDQKQWQTDFNQVRLLLTPYPHLSILESLAIDNERMVPQQAVSTVTNIDDIEQYIKEREIEKKKKYLTVIDLPLKERNKVMRELHYMGITAGSLFPGLDGACEELRERFFDI